jgi:hypothetical protein
MEKNYNQSPEAIIVTFISNNNLKIKIRVACEI